MESKPRKLPKSRKAMEYRVYWLEQKLKHLKVSEHRKEHGVKIAHMEDGPVKSMLHLNNEFNEANERAAGMHLLTEELNRDTVKLNERTERLHEVAAEKLANMDRANRQSHRIQERGRQINKESLKTAAISRAVTKATQDHATQMQRQIEEASHLADLTRAQHEATDKLNQRTRELNEETVKTTASSLTINRHLADTTESAKSLNEKTAALQAELSELKAELERLGDETDQRNEHTAKRLGELETVQVACETVSAEAEQFLTEGRAQITTAREICADAAAMTEACAKATDTSLAQQNQLKYDFDATRTSLELTGEVLKQEVETFVRSQQSELAAFCHEQSDALENTAATHLSKLDAAVDSHLNESSQTIEATLASSTMQLNEQLANHQAALEQREQHTNTAIKKDLEQFSQDARLRFIALEDRSKRLTTEFADDASRALTEFKVSGDERISQADVLLQTLSGEVQQNVEKSSQCRTETETLLEHTRAFNEDTEQLNDQTRALIARSTSAFDQVDRALEEVNKVNRKMFRETRELQDRTEALTATAEQTATELKNLNEQSLEIQQDSIKTQTLSQEINRHSLDLNEETQRLQQEFGSIRASNERLVDDLLSLKAILEALNLQSVEQLEQTKNATDDATGAKETFEALSSNTASLNEAIVSTLSKAERLVAEAERQSVASAELFNRADVLTHDLEATRQTLATEAKNAQAAAERADRSAAAMMAAKDEMAQTTRQTEAVTDEAKSCLASLHTTNQATLALNEETRDFQGEMQTAIEHSRQINDDFMRGLESLSRKAEQTEQQTQTLLAETQSIQLEMNNILDLKHGIDGFQRAVDDGRNELNGLIQKVEQCQEKSSSHERIVSQYQQRMETYQADVTRYRESILQLEKRFRGIDSQFQAQEIRHEDAEHQFASDLQAQKDALEQLTSELKQSVAAQQAELDRTKMSLREDSEKIIERLKHELAEDLDHKIEVANRSTNNLLTQTDGELRLLNSEVQQLNRSMLDEIATLKNETATVNEQTSLLRTAQDNQLNEQRNRSQQQEFELETLKHQLENYQRLIETQIDNSPVEQLQQRVKQLENMLRQQQRSLKQQEAENDKPKTDARVTELQNVVQSMHRSMEEIVATNKELKLALDETRNANQSLSKTNRELELSLSANQGELEHCLQRLHRLEGREATLEETLNAIRNRESDTQQTLQQMRNAVKDSTQTMRETQKTLESLGSNGKKRDWLSPRQAVVNSIFAAAITTMGFLSFDDVNAAYQSGQPASEYQVSATMAPAPIKFQPTPERQTKLLANTLADLKVAKESIQELGEFAWPVNFGIVDPEQIQYRKQHQGISISAELGDPVVAINDGTVVYSGNQIRGYGNMIVIQHDQELLSVYANNQFNYVSEGDQVRRGQLIGDIGQLFNEETAGLYFEIRHDGAPTDPFNYLNNHAASGASNFELLSAR